MRGTRNRRYCGIHFRQRMELVSRLGYNMHTFMRMERNAPCLIGPKSELLVSSYREVAIVVSILLGGDGAHAVVFEAPPLSPS
jgi:hypothetical protein